MNQAEAEDVKRVKHSVDALMEFFDSVQLFVTRHDHDDTDGEGNTFHITVGKGNWFTRWGQVQDFIKRREVYFDQLGGEPEDS